MSEAITEPNFHGPVPYTKITSERYISTEYMLKERDNIWSKTWLVAGPAQDVEEPGDFFVFELEPESIIVSRSEAGELGAFLTSANTEAQSWFHLVLVVSKNGLAPTTVGLLTMTEASHMFPMRTVSAGGFRKRSCH